MKTINVLFLCTHNSARSILAQAWLNHVGAPRFCAFSAGSNPRNNQQPHPLGLEVLHDAGVDTKTIANLRSQSWDDFANVAMDLIITVCDNAANEVCPIWPGHPATAHWSYPDPSAGDATDAEKKSSFNQVLLALQRRLAALVILSDTELNTENIQTSARKLSSV